MKKLFFTLGVVLSLLVSSVMAEDVAPEPEKTFRELTLHNILLYPDGKISENKVPVRFVDDGKADYRFCVTLIDKNLHDIISMRCYHLIGIKVEYEGDRPVKFPLYDFTQIELIGPEYES